MLIVNHIYDRLREPMSARGMYLMQRVWAAVVSGTLLFQWRDIEWFYGKEGALPLTPDTFGIFTFPQFSLFYFVSNPTAIYGLYVVLLSTLMLIVFDRFHTPALILSILLLHSFHLRNPFILGGGDVILFSIGFLLCIFTVIEGPLTRTRIVIPSWLYLLLLWQVVIIYFTSLWSKLLGTTWIDGSAVALVFQHPQFSRFAVSQSFILFFSPFICYIVMIWEALWLLVLIPRWQYHDRFMSFLLMNGILFHIGIFVFLYVGSFSIAMLTAYTGLYQFTHTLKLWSSSPFVQSQRG